MTDYSGDIMKIDSAIRKVYLEIYDEFTIDNSLIFPDELFIDWKLILSKSYYPVLIVDYHVDLMDYDNVDDEYERDEWVSKLTEKGIYCDVKIKVTGEY